jgi:hypothetical protein
VGDRKRVSRKRAVGTRERIVAYLAGATELFDSGGMASTRLATAVGYPGSSVAFAQLLSGMERSGLIERDVRGKRTYRIRLGPASGGPGSGGPALAGLASGGPGSGGLAGAGVPAAASGPAASVPAADEPTVSGRVAAGGAAGEVSARAGGASGVRGLAGMLGSGPAAGFDYDELARRLLAQVVRRLPGPDPGVTPDVAVLRDTVAGLEQELAEAWAKHGKLAEENVRLREELRAAEQSLALARESLRRMPVAADLDSTEVLLIQQLLAGDTAAWEAARPLRA